MKEAIKKRLTSLRAPRREALHEVISSVDHLEHLEEESGLSPMSLTMKRALTHVMGAVDIAHFDIDLDELEQDRAEWIENTIETRTDHANHTHLRIITHSIGADIFGLIEDAKETVRKDGHDVTDLKLVAKAILHRTDRNRHTQERVLGWVQRYEGQWLGTIEFCGHPTRSDNDAIRIALGTRRVMPSESIWILAVHVDRADIRSEAIIAPSRLPFHESMCRRFDTRWQNGDANPRLIHDHDAYAHLAIRLYAEQLEALEGCFEDHFHRHSGACDPYGGILSDIEEIGKENDRFSGGRG